MIDLRMRDIPLFEERESKGDMFSNVDFRTIPC